MKKRFTLLFAMLAALVTTAMADNVISAEALTIAQSGNADLTINLTNSDEVRGIQLTVTLPEGVTVVADPDAKIPYEDGGTQNYTPQNAVSVSTTDRTNGWTVVGNKVSDNVYKFVLISLNTNAALAAGEGAIMKISFAAAADASIESLNKGVAISDVHLAAVKEVDGNMVITEVAQTADASTNLTVIEFMKGDANGDGNITIVDAVMTLYVSVGKTVTINRLAVDIDGNDQITLIDAVKILYFSVGKITSFDTNTQARGIFDTPIDPD